VLNCNRFRQGKRQRKGSDKREHVRL
jgi:hypothetical protein